MRTWDNAGQRTIVVSGSFEDFVRGVRSTFMLKDTNLKFRFYAVPLGATDSSLRRVRLEAPSFVESIRYIAENKLIVWVATPADQPPLLPAGKGDWTPEEAVEKHHRMSFECGGDGKCLEEKRGGQGNTRTRIPECLLSRAWICRVPLERGGGGSMLCKSLGGDWAVLFLYLFSPFASGAALKPMEVTGLRPAEAESAASGETGL